MIRKIRDFIVLLGKAIKETLVLVKDIYTVEGKFEEVFKINKPYKMKKDSCGANWIIFKRMLRDFIIGFRFKKYGHIRQKEFCYNQDAIDLLSGFGFDYGTRYKLEKQIWHLGQDLVTFNSEIGTDSIPERPIVANKLKEALRPENTFIWNQ